MSTPAYLLLERKTYVTLFGLGLWDTVGHRITSEGLTVRIFALNNSSWVAQVSAFANRRGIFVARGLAGLQEAERGAGDDAFWSSPPTARPYLIEVRDATGEFLSFVIHTELPGARGYVMPACIEELAASDWLGFSPPTSPPSAAYVPLFNTSAYMAPAGMAMVRASLFDSVARVAAAWAVLDISDAGSGQLLARAVADERGEVAAIFPYPEIGSSLQSPPTSPPSSPAPLRQEQWTLGITVRYTGALSRYATDPLLPALPDLCDLVAQPAASVSTTSPPAAFTQATLTYGAELQLGADSGGQLLITPA